MLDDPSCPACGEHSWEQIGEQLFERDAAWPNAYLRLRGRVLFELWAPNTTSFRARFVLCQACGFVIYTPRATADEIDAKYRMIAEEQHAAGVATPVRTTVTALDQERSRELYGVLAPHLRGPGRLLDFGGGNGALMTHFAAAGFECGVVDYTIATVPNIARLGDTLDDLPAEARFDLVFCSHVFEHVAEPVDIAERLAARLNPEALLFIEVPLEILGGPPTMREPVTHVNFFCGSSLATSLRRAGLDIVECRTEACLFANGSYRYGVRAIARRSSAATPQDLALPGADEARRLLGAGPLTRASMIAANPRMLLNPMRSLGRRASSQSPREPR